MTLFIIFLIILTDIIGFGIIIPLLPQITTQMGINGWMLAILMASYSAAQFLASPILGGVSDRVGRKPVLIFSKAGTIVAYIIFAVTNNFWILVLSRIIDGFTGGNIPAARAYISDNTPPEKRSKGMALLGMAFGIGFIIGPVIGGIAYSVDGSKFWPGMIGAMLCTISLIFTQLFLKEDKSKFLKAEKKKIKLLNFSGWIQESDVKKIFIIQLVATAILASYQNSLTFFTNQVFNFNVSDNSKLFIYIGVLGIIIQGSLFRAKSFPAKKSVIIGLFVSVLGLMMVTLWPNLAIFYIALVIVSLGSGVVGIYLPTWLSTRSEKDPEGEIMGTYESIGSLGRIIGPALSSLLILKNPKLTYFLMGLILLLLTIGIEGNKIGLLPNKTRSDK